MGEQQNRRTARVLLKVPIEVKGKGTNGDAFQEKTATVMVDRHGAQIVLKSAPRPGEHVTITNLRSHKSCTFIVVRRVSKSLSAEAEWAVECPDPVPGFWGIHFPATESAAAPLPETETIEALLACRKCGSRELIRLTVEEYRTLSRQPSLARKCTRCAVSTEWGYSYIDTEDTTFVVSAPSAAKSGIEKRKSKRLAVTLPVRIRWEDGREELATTENLSKTGVCFASDVKMNVGDMVRLTVGDMAEGTPAELKGRIVRRHVQPGTNQTVYGVHVEEAS